MSYESLQEIAGMRAELRWEANKYSIEQQKEITKNAIGRPLEFIHVWGFKDLQDVIRLINKT